MKVLVRCVSVLLVLLFASTLKAQDLPDNAPLQVGDQITIFLPGEAGFDEPFTIQNNGTINLPEVGEVSITGMTLPEALEAIRGTLSRAYRQLDQLSVSLFKRNLIVTVLGYVSSPGEYVLDEDANVQIALAAAGGLRQGAQLDSIQLRRGSNIERFDYKRYLDTGDLRLIPPLQTQDVIFVPASPLIGNVQIDFDGRWLAEAGDAADEQTSIKVMGEVNNPANFAHRDGATIIDYLMRAGGVTRFASVEQIRVINGDTPVLFNMQRYLDTGNSTFLVDIAPGATIYVPLQKDEIRAGQSTIYVMGEVAKPGAYEGRDDATFIDILANAGGPTRFADTRNIRLIRSDGTVEMVDLVAFTERGGVDLPDVAPGDALFVPEKTEVEDTSWLKTPPERAIEIIGAVNSPGRYEWANEMSLFDLVAQAGGPTADADIANIQVVSKDGDWANSQRFDMEAFLERGGSFSEVPRLDAGSIILVPDRRTGEQELKGLMVRVMGYVNTPGEVDLPLGANIQQAITAAGGLRQGAQLDKMQLRRANDLLIVFNYKEYLDTGRPDALPDLEEGDEVFVPSSPLTGNVEVEFDGRTLSERGDGGDINTAIKVFGEVNTPGSFSFDEEATVVDYLMRAGGISGSANIQDIRVLSGGEPVLFDLQRYLDTGNLDAVPALAPGATVFVPPMAENTLSGDSYVYVMGEVAAPGAFTYRPRTSFIDLLANSGGPTRFSDTRQIRLIRADGSVEMIDLQRFTEGDTTVLPEIRAGDAIFVPEKAETQEISWLKVPPERAIEVIGAVYKPGRFEWSPEMTLFDIIAQAGGPNAQADLSDLQIVYRRDGRAQTVRFDADRFLKFGGSLSQVPQLEASSIVVVPELPQDPTDNKSQWVRQAPEDSIYIMGAVGAPGRYAFNDQMHFLDILNAADGPRVSADLRNVRVTHRSEPGAVVSKVNLALYLETGDDSILPHVRNGDLIYVPDQDRQWLEIPKETTVRVLGAVGSPGRYEYTSDMTILDLLAEAGGPQTDALVEKILIVNLSCCRDQARLFNLLDFAKTGNMKQLPVVRPGDTIFVPDVSRSNWRQVFDKFQDIVSALSVFALFSGL
ncbi:SLBB domain-containing protein [Pseudovibrio exalbescens]|uniref:polysaccharide biosynthesis/export family protein n=1 Tax=Pseudovibrio exalbescens TaxID=197461 RepID=UPI0023655BD3|nr:SLBB domain-containing protein [Pseudovibrio exalbescens]MDD7909230.1 SLBB domain-containing protein [Pseudovibrio exalbescens]